MTCRGLQPGVLELMTYGLECRSLRPGDGRSLECWSTQPIESQLDWWPMESHSWSMAVITYGWSQTWVCSDDRWMVIAKVTTEWWSLPGVLKWWPMDGCSLEWCSDNQWRVTAGNAGVMNEGWSQPGVLTDRQSKPGVLEWWPTDGHRWRVLTYGWSQPKWGPMGGLSLGLEFMTLGMSTAQFKVPDSFSL